MSEPFLGEIRMFAGNFAPVGWALCQGQLMPISQNTALFSLLGTTYGGDGHSTFALPDLQSRAPMHAGSGPGLTVRNLGENGGVAQIALTADQTPAHEHPLQAASGGGTTSDPAGCVLAGSAPDAVYATGNPDTPLAAGTVAPASGQSHTNLMPYLTVNFIIALQGIFPARN